MVSVPKGMRMPKVTATRFCGGAEIDNRQNRKAARRPLSHMCRTPNDDGDSRQMVTVV
jgi:hypothetical protein